MTQDNSLYSEFIATNSQGKNDIVGMLAYSRYIAEEHSQHGNNFENYPKPSEERVNTLKETAVGLLAEHTTPIVEDALKQEKESIHLKEIERIVKKYTGIKYSLITALLVGFTIPVVITIINNTDLELKSSDLIPAEYRMKNSTNLKDLQTSVPKEEKIQTSAESP